MITGCGSQGSPGAASSASPGSSTAASVDACATSQLKISLIDTGALAGQAGGYLKFTNDSRTSCHWMPAAGMVS